MTKKFNQLRFSKQWSTRRTKVKPSNKPLGHLFSINKEQQEEWKLPQECKEKRKRRCGLSTLIKNNKNKKREREEREMKMKMKMW